LAETTRVEVEVSLASAFLKD